MSRDPKTRVQRREGFSNELLEDMLLYSGAARGNATGALGPDAAPVPALYAMDGLVRAGMVTTQGRPDQVTTNPLIEP